MATIAVLIDNYFEDVEYSGPANAFKKAGHQLVHLGLQEGDLVKGKREGMPVTIERSVKDARIDDYDALFIPGGVASPDRLRLDPAAVRFTREFVDSGKPVASICHGPWLLVEADAVRGMTITSWPSLQTDIRNAGGTWVDEQVHVEQGIVTSRKPDDLQAFCAKMVEEIAEGRHTARAMGPGQKVDSRVGVPR